MPSPQTLPRWDMNAFFPGLRSPEFAIRVDHLHEAVDRLKQRFDELGIGTSNDVSASDVSKIFEELVEARNRLSDEFRLVNAYISGFTSTDSRDDFAKQKSSELDADIVQFQKLIKRFTAWVSALDFETLLKESQCARDHEYALRKSVVAALHMMEPELESLASDLGLTGSTAWARMYGDVTSQMEVELGEDEGETGAVRRMPISALRSLAHEPDREVRAKAYHAELKAWKSVEVPLTAAMNSIKGEAGLLSRRRGWAEPLDESLFASNIDRQTLDAMLSAARDSFPIFRRYLNAKARALGLKKLGFYDLFAPISSKEQAWDYQRATEFVVAQFSGYSSKLGGFAAKSFESDWIDVESRPGKRDGAFCMGVRGDESRILLNYKEAFGSVSTLAHELGHAYHNLCLSDRTAWQRNTPMTLAETASIFCETIVRQGVLRDGSPDEQLAVLEASLQGSTQVVVDITSRYLFESRVLEARTKRELASQELCEIMLQAQLETYGDGLNSEELHPYMWAAKPHYYGRSFYNFPYMFGLLFGLGIYAVYMNEPEGFHARYDDLLSSTGLADAATLAQRFGIDIRTPEFWNASLRQIELDVDRFEDLIQAT